MAKKFREHLLGLLALFILSLSIYGFIRLNSDHAAARSKELQQRRQLISAQLTSISLPPFTQPQADKLRFWD